MEFTSASVSALGAGLVVAVCLGMVLLWSFRQHRVFWLDAWNRMAEASKLEFAADILNVLGIAYAIAFTAFVIPIARLRGAIVSWWWFVGLVVASVYTSIVYRRLKTKLRKLKWKKEEILRLKALGGALASLASGIERSAFESLDLHHAEHAVLLALRSEVEALFKDAESLHFAADLIIPHRGAADTVVVLNRSNPISPLGVQFSREQSVVGRAITTQRIEYDPDWQRTDGGEPKPYRSIMAFPIVFQKADQKVYSLGGLSLVSDRPHHFDGYQDQLRLRLAPYLSLLLVCLVCREKYGAWPTFMGAICAQL